MGKMPGPSATNLTYVHAALAFAYMWVWHMGFGGRYCVCLAAPLYACGGCPLTWTLALLSPLPALAQPVPQQVQ